MLDYTSRIKALIDGRLILHARFFATQTKYMYILVINYVNIGPGLLLITLDVICFWNIGILIWDESGRHAEAQTSQNMK